MDRMRTEYARLEAERRRESAAIRDELRLLDGSIGEWREHFDAYWKIWTPVNTFKYMGLDAAGRPAAFAIVSSGAEPDAVAENVANAEEMRRVLGPLGDVIPAPSRSGVIDRLSYAIFPYHSPFRFQRGPLGWLGRSMLSRRVLPWLRAVIEATASEPTAEERRDRFIAPLERLRDEPSTPDEFRSAAEAALDRLAAGAWRPRLAFMHDDLNSSNLLRPAGPAAWRRPPIIIDWERATHRGHGFYDLLGMIPWMNLGARRLRDEFDRHCGLLDCSPGDVGGYLLAVLGIKSQAFGDAFPEAIWERSRRIARNEVIHSFPCDQRKTAVDVSAAITRFRRWEALAPRLFRGRRI